MIWACPRLPQDQRSGVGLSAIMAPGLVIERSRNQQLGAIPLPSLTRGTSPETCLQTPEQPAHKAISTYV